MPDKLFPNITAHTPRILKALRRKAGLSQQVLGERLGKSRSFVARVENGKRQLTEQELTTYLDRLKTPLKTYASMLASLDFIASGANFSDDNYPETQPSGKPVLTSQSAIIAMLRQYFKDKPVKDAYLFGSVARDSHSTDSDIDIYLSFQDDFRVTLFDLARMRSELAEATGRAVDLVVAGSEYSFVRSSLHEDKIKVYG